MIDPVSQEETRRACKSDGLVRPLYGGYCFSEIPTAILSLFNGSSTNGHLLLPGTPREIQNAVVIFFDSLGWDVFEKNISHPLIRMLTQEGTTLRLTAQFPSTTAAHITTLFSGIPVSMTGIYEWFYYEPIAQQIISPLLFSTRSGIPGDLTTLGLAPKDIFPKQSLIARLQERGITVHSIQPQAIAGSLVSSYLLKNSIPYTSVQSATMKVIEAAQLAAKGGGRNLIYLYLDQYDGACHHFGPQSNETAAVRNELFQSCLRILEELPKDTAFLLFADHGHAATPAAGRIDLRREVPALQESLRVDPHSNALLAPAGSPRDLFLHVKDDKLDRVRKQLISQLDQRAHVLTQAELLEQGFFGSTYSKRLLDRLGDLVVLPCGGASIWWDPDPESAMPTYLGYHGGASPTEMYVPFCSIVRS